MPENTRLKPMSNLEFHLMTWMMNLTDLFKSPRLLLNKVPIKEGMVIADPWEAKSEIEGIGLFSVTKFDGKDILLVKK
jgi:hypothetical protein